MLMLVEVERVQTSFFTVVLSQFCISYPNALSPTGGIHLVSKVHGFSSIHVVSSCQLISQIPNWRKTITLLFYYSNNCDLKQKQFM